MIEKKRKEEEVRKVPLSAIRANPHQPRKQFLPEELSDLAASIRAIGIIQPPVVRLLPEGCYELIAGERRLRAAELAGLSEINVMVRAADDAFSLEAALIENIQRADLNPIEIARALKEMVSTYQIDQETLAKKVGKKRSTVANYMRLLQLPPLIQSEVETLKISMGHAKVLLSCPDFATQQKLLDLILTAQLTVRQAEIALVKWSKKERSTSRNHADIFLADLSHQLQERLGTKVSFSGNAKEGKLMIDYFSLEDLNRILTLLNLTDP
ncbi:MAG: putative chromosome-partitioning protein parB [Chlamydiales bacterium]|jgi:ParB family chromosome partitioning protein|nr:putative chromosome-partitioning protein parB [Chlamydiales bacterium]